MLISNAYAGTTPPATDWTSLIPLVVIVIVFWLMLIRPQMKQAKEQAKLLTNLRAGDEVITSGGIVGKITQVEEAFVHLEIASGVVLKIQKTAVQIMLPKSASHS